MLGSGAGRNGLRALSARGRPVRYSILTRHPDAVVLHLGCGLDTRAFRVQPPATVDWYTVDLTGISAVRDQVLPTNPQSHTVVASVAESDWATAIPADRPTILIADGLFAFLTEAVIFNTDELNRAPRVVAAQEGYVSMSQGQLAYLLGDLQPSSGYRLFREPKPLYDWDSKELLGYEARYVGTADFVRPGSTLEENGKPVIVPATVSIKSVRMEVSAGDRLAPLPKRDLDAYAPHHPNAPMSGRVLQIYGDGLSAGQNQIVALNRGARDGMERGHVLALWRTGDRRVKQIDGERTTLQLPNESNGLLFVFNVFERTSYALILSVNVPVFPGDSFTQP